MGRSRSYIFDENIYSYNDFGALVSEHLEWNIFMTFKYFTKLEEIEENIILWINCELSSFFYGIVKIEVV